MLQSVGRNWKRKGERLLSCVLPMYISDLDIIIKNIINKIVIRTNTIRGDRKDSVNKGRRGGKWSTC
jgi:hypothetical protein